MEFEIEPPIEVFNAVNAQMIGRSEAALHETRYKKTYEKQGFGVNVRFTKETLKNGSTIVRLFVNLTKQT